MKKRGPKLKLTKRLRIPKDNHEVNLKEQGFNFICGLDEVGRGAWAGPLVAAAVILDRRYYKLRDSKLLTSKDREKLSRKIKKTCFWGIGEVSVEEIDELKLTKATQLAFRRAVENLKVKPDFVLSDGFKFDSPLPCLHLIKGDMNCVSIAAASIIAKVYRDKLMLQLDEKIEGYSFGLHKGYGTKLHQKRLEKLGPSVHHRRCCKPIGRLTNRDYMV
ncbi:MAG: ribonuclease HII [Patescibacteria group bacterium]|nr:ribonuclease HII [Patescibacteria group bacterium]